MEGAGWADPEKDERDLLSIINLMPEHETMSPESRGPNASSGREVDGHSDLPTQAWALGRGRRSCASRLVSSMKCSDVENKG